MRNVFVVVFILFLAVGCNKKTSNSTSTSTSTPERTVEEARPEGKPEKGGKGKGQRPSLDEMFSRMDANNDGKLSKSEVKGRLQRDFSKIDTDKDGFISRTELENAPKPERGSRPKR